MVAEQVVVVAGSRSAPIASVTVGTLGMTGVVKTLGNEAPLHGQVFHAVYRTTFVDAPANGAMVDDDVFLIHASQTITFMISYIGVAQAKTHKADDDVARVDGEGVIGDADTITRCCLSGDGNVAAGKRQGTG
jgi:hypothetical protein